LRNPGSFTFTTGTGADSTYPSTVSYTPHNLTTGLRPTIRVVFSERMDPLTITPSSFYIYRTSDYQVIPNTSITVSPDRKTATLNLPGPLDAGTQYYWYLCSAYDQA